MARETVPQRISIPAEILQGSTWVYEVDSSTQPVTLYDVRTSRTDSSQSWEREKIATYETFDQGIGKTTREEKRYKRLGRTLIAAGATGISAAVAVTTLQAAKMVDIPVEEQYTATLSMFPSFMVGMVGWLARDASTRARLRKEALSAAQSSDQTVYEHPTKW